jgi:membrane protease YdiL (CAAX protease family)
VKATTAAAAAAAGAWALLVSASPRWFFPAAAPLCAIWMALSARAAPAGLAGLAGRLRPRPGDLGAALTVAVALHAGARAFLWAGCGGLTDALCAPVADTLGRFRFSAFLPALVLVALAAPAEELFWRGFVQERLVRRLGRRQGVAATTGMAVAVALGTREPLLALATLPTYAAWGALAEWRGSLFAPVVSHAAWTLLFAVIAPPG